MARSGGTSPRRPGRASHRPPTDAAGLPDGPVRTSTGTVELVRSRDDPDGVTVVVNGVPSSHLDLADPTRLDFEYMQQMAVVVDRVAEPGASLRVLHLGAAGCTFARYVHATRPGSHQLAVELDATLAELVRGWFDLPRSPPCASGRGRTHRARTPARRERGRRRAGRLRG
ncbi:hypothetical protein [Cellulomonas sp. ATA003]|uniref:spermidine synthase n=1 Tax=Cellulomonas sp. ATA003 TaxID=3073064 RepID=UPI0028734367|nr:hypothetical protein [Cellulomonas sp. ATA003]WNB87647.1 hypothetical protein REH70_14140 [Cellulomonas sp. ATA003]